MKNILILSAGRRVDLVQDFQTELKKFDSNAKVFTTDLNPALSSACQVADGSFSVPRATAPNYCGELISLCLKNDIGLVVPTIDTELLPLASRRDEFWQKGIHLIVSDKELVGLCRDKRKTSDLFRSHNIPAPREFTTSSLEFPCFIKPFDGSCSVGIMKANTPSEIPSNVLQDPRMMFMEYVDPKKHSEFTVDLYYGKDHKLKCLVPRKRIEIRGGEVSKGITLKGHLYSYLLERLQTMKGAIGCITFQIFANEEERSYYGIEVNPRFGGGYPLSYAAGAKYPEWLIREYLKGETISFFDGWENNLLMLRYDAKVLVHGHHG